MLVFSSELVSIIHKMHLYIISGVGTHSVINLWGICEYTVVESTSKQGQIGIAFYCGS